MITGHHLFLHRSPLIVTNYIDVKIKELGIVLTKVTLHTRHALSKNKTKFKISKIILLYKNFVIGQHYTGHHLM